MLTEEQKERRKNGIGASDSPIIMGYSSFKTPYELYLEKKGVLEQTEESELQKWGNKLEPVIIDHFAEVNNMEVTFPDTIYHPEYPFIFANLDGFCKKENAVVEAKMANSFMKKMWDKALEDGIPNAYLIQIAKQVALADADVGYCAVLIGGFEYMQFTYQRDKELEEFIIESDKRFWHCVQNNIEPEPMNVNDCKLKYRDSSAEDVVVATKSVEEYINRMLQLKGQQKQLVEIENKSKMKIMDFMKEKEVLEDTEGKTLATWKKSKKGNRIFNLKGQ